jgi:hypothetical protein
MAPGKLPGAIPRKVKRKGGILNKKRNFDAFADCFWDIDIPQEGAVLVFSRFDAFWQRWRTFAFDLLDLLERRSRSCLLFGKRLIILVQSNHANISFQPVGACPVLLNPTEELIRMKQIWKKSMRKS